MLRLLLFISLVFVVACEKKPAEVKAEPAKKLSFVERYAAAPAKTMFEYDDSERAKILKELETMPAKEAASAAHELLVSQVEPVVGHAFSRLPEETRAKLAEDLKGRLGDDPVLWQELEKSRLIRIRDEPRLTVKGLHVLTKDAETMQKHQWGVDRYLKSYVLHDSTAATKFACDVLSRESLPESMTDGSPNQITFAAVAATEAGVCPGIERIKTDMCKARCLRGCSMDEMREYVETERKYNQFQESTQGAKPRPEILPTVIRANYVLAGVEVDCP